MKNNTRQHPSICRASGTASTSQPPRWNKDQIRSARMVAIAPLLEKRGLHLIETGGGNHRVREYSGLIIKDAFWRWPEHHLSGNCIDLCLLVLRMDFHHAMLEISKLLDAHEHHCPPKTS